MSDRSDAYALESKHRFLGRSYADADGAFQIIILASIIWLATYSIFHIISGAIDDQNRCTLENIVERALLESRETDGNESACDLKPWASAVKTPETNYYKPEYDTDLLLRFFSPKRVEEFIDDTDQLYENISDNTLARRKQVISGAALFLRNEGLGQSLPHFFAGAGVAPGDTFRSVLSDDDYRLLNIKNIITWFEKQKDAIPPEQHDDFDFHLAEMQSARLVEAEDLQGFVEDSANRLEHEFSFLWLYHASLSWGWIVELAFWSILGVLVHTLVALMTTSRASFSGGGTTGREEPMPEYDAERFSFIFPKFILAPVVATVVLALVVTGLTGLEVTISNLPFFLLFAFIAGFASERFTAVIRNVVNHLIPRFEIDPERFQSQYGAEVRDRVRYRNVATNLRDLETIVRDEVATEAIEEFERRSPRGAKAADSEPKG